MVEAPGSNAIAQHFCPPCFLIRMRRDVTDDNIDHGIDHDKDLENSEIHPLQLQPSSQSLSSSQLTEVDCHLKSSIPFNVAFLLGSALSLELSRIYLKKANNYYDTNDKDYDGNYDDDYDWDYYYNHYKHFNLFNVKIFGGLFMIVSAIWEIYWYFGREIENGGRRLMRGMSSALAFGIAVSIGVGAEFIPNEKIAGIGYFVSTNMYFLSAILALRGRVLSCPSLPTGLALVGDILGAFGSVIGVAISLIPEPETFYLNDRILAQWSCVSSILWFIDALLYFAANMTVVLYRYRLYSEDKKSASGDKRHGFETVKSLT